MNKLYAMALAVLLSAAGAAGVIFWAVNVGKSAEKGEVAVAEVKQAKAETKLAQKVVVSSKKVEAGVQQARAAAKQSLEEIRNEAGGDDRVCLSPDELREWNERLGDAPADRPLPADGVSGRAAALRRGDEPGPAREPRGDQAAVRGVPPAAQGAGGAGERSPRSRVEERLNQLFN